MRHLGILATTPEGAALCFRAFCKEGFAELGPHDHPDVTLDCVALARSLPTWQAGDYASVRATLSASVRRLAGRRGLPTWRGGPVTVPPRGVPSIPDLIMGDPDDSGFFGEFGGRYVPEPLMAACKEVEDAFRAARADPAFRDEFARELANYAGRPSPLTEPARMSERLGVRLLLKREDLMHTGSHKINNVIGQALLARRMGKKTLIAETGAGQHGVAVATAAALYGMKCVVYMGEVDMRRQAPNVFRMGLLGAEVIPTTCGSRTLKDAVSDAMRRWVSEVAEAHFCDGSVVGPHPYPWMVREFQRVIGDEARDQCRGLLGGRDPDVVVACVGGGSNAAGIFAGFAHLPHVALVGAEAMGSAAISRGQPGVVHGAKSFVLQDDAGQILESTGISAGLGYPGIGPEHSYLAETGRARYVAVTDDEVLAAFQLMASTEGIIPALEPAHAIAWVAREREALAGKTVLVNLSGRGDKDIDHVRKLLGR